MKKLVTLLTFLIVGICSAQLTTTKAIDFVGAVTSTERDSWDVPANTYRLIYNVTTGQLEIGDENENWTGIGSGGGGSDDDITSANLNGTVLEINEGSTQVTVDLASLSGGGSYTFNDTAEIDLVDSSGTVTAVLVNGSIDESKLDASTNTSLGLADTSLQPGDNISGLTNDAGFVTTDNDTQLSDAEVATAVNNEFPNLDTDVTDDFDGDYNSLSNLPTIPTNNNQLTNGAGYITSAQNTFNVALETNGTQLRVRDNASNSVSIEYSEIADNIEDIAEVDWGNIQNMPAGFADGVDNTGGAGSDGVVSNVALNGTDLDFTGADGGFNGTVSLASLAGQDGADGADGATGPQGPQGVAGNDGADGADGLGWTSGSYNAGTGVVTFLSDDGLGFTTGDLRGADGADGNDGADGAVGPQGPAGDPASDDQDLTLTGNTLAISGDPNTDVDLSPYLDDTTLTDAQVSTAFINENPNVDLDGSNDVTLSDTQEISGEKRFDYLHIDSENISGGNASSFLRMTSVSSATNLLSPAGSGIFYIEQNGELSISWDNDANNHFTISPQNLTTGRSYLLPDKTGTIALLDDISGGGGTISDGTYEDIIVSNSGADWNLAQDVVGTFEMANNSVSNSILINGSVSFAKIAPGDIATQGEAEAGTSTNTLMTPERTAQAIAALASGGGSGNAGNFSKNEMTDAGTLASGDVSNNTNGTVYITNETANDKTETINNLNSGQANERYVFHDSNADGVTRIAEGTMTFASLDKPAGASGIEILDGGYAEGIELADGTLSMRGDFIYYIVDNTAPSTPTNLTNDAQDDGTLDYSWDASTDNIAVTGYEGSIDDGAAIDLGLVTSHQLTGLTNGTSYDFKVRAYDAAGNRSAYTANVSGTPQSSVNLGPEELTNGGFDADATWVKNNNSTISGGFGNLLSDGTPSNGQLGPSGSNASFWQDPDLPTGTDYQVEILCRRDTGTGVMYIGQINTDLYSLTPTVANGVFETYTFTITTSEGGGRFAIGCETGEGWTIDSVSVKEIL